MENDKVISLLLNRPKTNDSAEGRAMEGFLDRLLVRIYSYTSLISYLYDAKVVGENIEVVFNELPPEIVSKVVAIIGVPETETFSFRMGDDNNHLCTGYRFRPTDEMLQEL